MKKIPTIFKRGEDHKVIPEPHPDCLWVFEGEGVATRKYDGTCVAIIEGKYYKRREVKKGKNPPPDFIEVDYDPITGKRFGWVPVNFDDPADRYHVEAFNRLAEEGKIEDGTYELCGPKIQGNPENFPYHVLIKHSEAEVFPDCPRDYEGLKEWLADKDIEGIVFHHPDGRMAKIKKRDFGLKRR